MPEGNDPRPDIPEELGAAYDEFMASSEGDDEMSRIARSKMAEDPETFLRVYRDEGERLRTLGHSGMSES